VGYAGAVDRTRLPFAALLALGACAEPQAVRPTHHPLPGSGGGQGDSAAPDSGGAPDSGAGGAWLSLPVACPDGAPAPAPLVEVGALFLQDHVFAEVLDVAVDGARGLAVAVGQGGVMVVDLADPAAPRFRGANAPADGQREHQVVLGEGGLAYTTHRDFGLTVWDTADPGRPVRVGRVSDEGLMGLDRAGSHLYVAQSDGALHTYSLADPRAPRREHTLAGFGNPRQPLVLGDTLVLADHAGTLHLLSRSDPAAPAVRGAVELPAGGLDVAASADGRAVYVAVGAAGVAVVDPSGAGARVTTLDLRHAAISVAVDGDTLWAATQQDVVAFDVRDPLSPRPIGGLTTDQWAMAVAAGGGYAVVGDWGWLRTVAADLDAAVPDALLQARALSLDPGGGPATLELANLGGGPLALHGATASDPRLVLRADRRSVGPAAAARLQVDYAGRGGGAPLDAEICISTDDPDEPTLRLRVVDAAAGGDALGQPAPDFTLDTLGGERLTLSEQAGFPVVLVYFATW
jgi:hypothetical protein